MGSAELQYSMKKNASQARPLTVNEVVKLHQIAGDGSRSIVDRVFASHALMALYARARKSDFEHLEEVLHDTNSQGGYVQVNTRHQKGARTAEKKALLLPIVISSEGVKDPSWLFF